MHEPTRLPTLVTGVSVLCDSGADPTVHYALAGLANADTVPVGVPQSQWNAADLQAGRIHGPTEIIFRGSDGTTLDAPLTGGTSIVTDTLSDGVPARVTTMASGLGPVRVEWSTGGRSYLLLSAIGTTADGTSGPTVDDLLAMAGSVA